MSTSMLLSEITLEPCLQPRSQIFDEWVTEYAEALERGDKFPPVEVYCDGSKNFLVDGYHRWHAHKKIGRADIAVNVTQGSMREARWASFAANKQHGHRRLSNDAKRVIEAILQDDEWSKYSQVIIAKHVGVSQQYVSKVINDLQPSCKSNHQTTGRDGRTINTANIGKKPEKTTTREIVDNKTGEVIEDYTETKTTSTHVTPLAATGKKIVSLAEYEGKRDKPKTSAAFRVALDEFKRQIIIARNQEYQGETNRVAIEDAIELLVNLL
jgi:hypothetical protein